jgi:hypothetical protein
MRKLVTLMGLGLSLQALAASNKRETKAKALASGDRGPVVNAGEMPALASLLEKAGWTPTPELSGVFRAGSIFEVKELGHSLVSSSCILGRPEESTYTATELVSSLQAGVSVGWGAAAGEATAGIVKKTKFGTPTQITVPSLSMKLKPSSECGGQLKAWPKERVFAAYVVQEVLIAEISEQTCGKVDAKGRFVGLGAAEAEYASACAQASLEPVAVGYRTVPLSSLMDPPIGGTKSAQTSTFSVRESTEPRRGLRAGAFVGAGLLTAGGAALLVNGALGRASLQSGLESGDLSGSEGAAQAASVNQSLWMGYGGLGLGLALGIGTGIVVRTGAGPDGASFGLGGEW